jgi:hypothetical protein
MSSDRRATAIHAELLEDRGLAAEVYVLMIEDPRTEPILWASVVLSSQGLDRFGEYLEELDAAVRHPSEAPPITAAGSRYWTAASTPRIAAPP